MNRRIAATGRWGAKEILARADELAERAIALWPAPLQGVGRAERSRDWNLAHQVLAALPHGTWTSYGDLAAFLGSGAQAVGNHLANTPGVVNAYRVLNADGKVSDKFRWTSQDESGEVQSRLIADGIHFTASGAADPAQRLTSDDLALLLSGTEGREEEEETGGGEAVRHPTENRGGETRAERFARQLAANDTPETVTAVRSVLARWEELGGWVGHGSGRVTTSAFLMLGEQGNPGYGVWPMTLYPGGGRGGTAEVVFQHLASREPFTDRALRAEFLKRLNELEGVDIPEGKLELRPSFRLAVLEDDHNRELLCETLAWFRQCWENREAV
ncbi:MGMT family protein [Streptomyces sp. KL2]|uniref:MGMT family protein n=1 Tax=Streptomyces sp. KL2 TaxID=3050126 RepID=UPI00397910AD